VIIPCRDDSYLQATLESLGRQEGAPAFEVIIVDDSPAKDLSERLSWWEGRLDLQILPARNPGTPGGNRNLGVAASKGDLVIFVDADDTVNPRYVGSIVDALESHPLVCARLDLSLLNPGKLWESHPQQKGLISTDLRFLPFASAGTLGISKKAFVDIGGFDASLTCYEEADLCWRIQLAGGAPPTFVPQAVSHHRLERDAVKRLRKAMRYGATEAALYSRYRAAGMQRQGSLHSAAAWGLLLAGALGRILGRPAPGIGWRVANRLGRVAGSIRHRVAYL
jgi:GT2 family glycosyltransferase